MKIPWLYSQVSGIRPFEQRDFKFEGSQVRDPEFYFGGTARRPTA